MRIEKGKPQTYQLVDQSYSLQWKLYRLLYYFIQRLHVALSFTTITSRGGIKKPAMVMTQFSVLVFASFYLLLSSYLGWMLVRITFIRCSCRARTNCNQHARFFDSFFFSLLFTNHNNSSRHALFFSSYTSAIFIQGSCETDQLTTNTIIMPSIHLVSAFLQILKSFFNSLNIKREENKKMSSPTGNLHICIAVFS